MCMILVTSRYAIPLGTKVIPDPESPGQVKQIPTTINKEDFTGLSKKIVGKIEQYLGRDDKRNYLYKIQVTDDWLKT